MGTESLGVTFNFFKFFHSENILSVSREEVRGHTDKMEIYDASSLLFWKKRSLNKKLLISP